MAGEPARRPVSGGPVRHSSGRPAYWVKAGSGEGTRRLVITDGVFSMDGDLAPLPAIVAVARRHGAMVMVDDAHSEGVLGDHGRGIVHHFGLTGQVEVEVGTLSKAFSPPLLDRIVILITTLGDEEFYMVTGALILWLIDKKIGFRAVLIIVLSHWLNGWLKSLFDVPRPDPEVVRVIRPEPGTAFPSGHTQTTTALWGCLAVHFRRRWFTALALIVIPLVALSRPYLGVHYPVDLLGGLVAALALLGIFLAITRRVEITGLPDRLGFRGRLITAAVLPLGLMLFPGPDVVWLAGFLWGFAVGRVIEFQLVRFATRGSAIQHIAKAIIGLAVLFALRTGLKAIFPAGDLFHFLRYAVMALWGVFLAPWCFVVLRLAGREAPVVLPSIQA